jgi:hypothetical protein
MGDKVQRCKTVDRGREARNRDVRQETDRTGDKEQRRKTGDSGREARSRALRQGTEDGSQ